MIGSYRVQDGVVLEEIVSMLKTHQFILCLLFTDEYSAMNMYCGSRLEIEQSFKPRKERINLCIIDGELSIVYISDKNEATKKDFYLSSEECLDFQKQGKISFIGVINRIFNPIRNYKYI